MDRHFWNEAFIEDADGVMVRDVILDAELEGLTPGTALDLGCGTGHNALKLAARGWSVLGVDWATHAIEAAQQAAAQRGLDASFASGDVTTWQPPRHFDLVISTYALPGGTASEQVLQTAVAALAPGGTLIVAEWDRSMAPIWGFDPDELVTPEMIAALLPDLVVERAEVKRVEDMFAPANDPRGHAGTAANIAFVRARKPA